MLWYLATGLDSAAFRVEVVCLFEGGAFADALERSDIPLQVLGLDRRYLPQNWVHTWRALRRTGADVVHTYQPTANWYGLPGASLERVPVRISHLHSVYAKWSAKARALDRATRRFASASVACSEAVGQFARTRGYGEGRLRVIPNGIDLAAFEDLPHRLEARRELGLTGSGPLLISVASLYAHKGHAHLLEAMTRVRQEFPQAQLLLVGGGNRERTEAVRENVDALRLGDAVRMLGPRDDVPKLLAASDVFVMPSLREGLPMSLLEAGAAGLPAVASAVGGIPEVVEHGVTGVLIPAGDVERLSEGLLELLRDPVRRQELGEAAQLRVSARFGLTRTIEALEGLYVDLLARQAA
jgi:glycosyltransferase involved in cell wall biosynthesis